MASGNFLADKDYRWDIRGQPFADERPAKLLPTLSEHRSNSHVFALQFSC